MSASQFERITCNLNKEMYCLFGFLLDSVEGLAWHSFDSDKGIMEVYVPQNQTQDYEKFMQIWQDFQQKMECRCNYHIPRIHTSGGNA